MQDAHSFIDRALYSNLNGRWRVPLGVELSVSATEQIGEIYFYSYSSNPRIWMSLATKKRKYSEEYLKFGFMNIMDKGVEKPQCVICDKILGVDSLRPRKKIRM